MGTNRTELGTGEAIVLCFKARKSEYETFGNIIGLDGGNRHEKD